MNIKILGNSGCKNCEKLYDKIYKLLDKLEYDIKLEKITSVLEMSKYGITSIPGLVIDEKVIIEGVVPSDEELIRIISGESLDNIVNESECSDGVCRF